MVESLDTAIACVNGAFVLHREISNVAKVCKLPGFRYVAFDVQALPERRKPLPVEGCVPETAWTEPAPDLIGPGLPLEAVEAPTIAEAQPVAMSAPMQHAPIAFALLDDIGTAMPRGRQPANIPAMKRRAAVARPTATSFALLAEVSAAIAAGQAAFVPERGVPAVRRRPRKRLGVTDGRTD